MRFYTRVLAETPAGRKGSMAIGLELNGPIEDAMKTLRAKGLEFQGEVNDSKAGKFVGFLNPDGNQLYLAELRWTHVNQGEGKYQHA